MMLLLKEYLISSAFKEVNYLHNGKELKIKVRKILNQILVYFNVFFYYYFGTLSI